MALAPLIAAALERQALAVRDEDVLLVCQKIVSKSEGRFVDLDAIEDRPAADGRPYLNPLRDVGRNDPCPCGSGKKYKKCCLAA